MDITSLSTGMSQTSLLGAVSTAMTAKNIDMMEQQGNDMVKMMERSVTPNLGNNIDLMV